MKRFAAVVLIAASALLPATAAAQSQTATRIAELRTFSGAFWQTMPRVSSACRGVVNETLHALAKQYIVMGADVPYHKVVEQVTLTISLTPVLNAPEVMSNLEWAECRELVFHGLGNRQLTRQEADGKAKQDRLEAERGRRKQTAGRFTDSCKAQGGYVDFIRVSKYIDGRTDQLKCEGVEAARKRQAEAAAREEVKAKAKARREAEQRRREERYAAEAAAKEEKKRLRRERLAAEDQARRERRDAKKRRHEETMRRLNSGG